MTPSDHAARAPSEAQFAAQCGQSGCENPGAYRYTWPGRDESVICEQHVGKLRAVADAMGLYLQVRPLAQEPAP